MKPTAYTSYNSAVTNAGLGVWRFLLVLEEAMSLQTYVHKWLGKLVQRASGLNTVSLAVQQENPLETEVSCSLIYLFLFFFFFLLWNSVESGLSNIVDQKYNW